MIGKLFALVGYALHHAGPVSFNPPTPIERARAGQNTASVTILKGDR